MPQIEIPQIPLRQLIVGTLAVVAVIVFFWLLFRFHDVLLLLFAGIIISTAIKPGVSWLSRRNVPRPASLLLIFSILLVLFVLLVSISVPVLVQQWTTIIDSLREGYRQLLNWLNQVPNILVLRLSALLPRDLLSSDPVAAETAIDAAGEVEPSLSQIMQQMTAIWEVFFDIIAIFILAFMWTMEGERLKQGAFLLIPMPKRIQIRELVQEIEVRISRYILGQGFLCLAIGLVSFIAYLLIGLPHAFFLAIVAGLLEAVPIIGPLLGAIPAVIIALSISPLTAVWVLVATAVIQQLENNLLVPRVMKQAVGLRPLVTILALVAFGSLYGILGALLALPLAAVIQLLVDRFSRQGENTKHDHMSRDHLGVLRYETKQLLADIRQQIKDKVVEPSATTDELEDEVESITAGLEMILTNHIEQKETS